ncbi:MAG TPA: DUF58 domain-containing protein [Chthonomonadaceae bacterium]|nr:DUF58 domain-containing protein [Chthonomonadaceae bacterium]
MIFSRRWLFLFALGVVPLLLTGLSPGYLSLALAWDGLLLSLAFADWMLFPSLDALQVERAVDDKLSLGVQNPVQVRIRNGTEVPLQLELRDSPPEAIPNDLPGTPFELSVAPGTRQAAVYHLTPQARGDYTFGDVYLRVRGRLGLVHRLRRVPLPSAVKVYPNLLETAKFNLMARRGRLQQVGIRAARLQGAGREFESLRDYMPDDELRRIDWKATARRGKLVARQYEVEKSQSVLLVLDVGRTMLAEIDGIQKLDYAINAALLLAYVATLSEDKVGLLVFADTVQAYLPPKKGRAQVYAILEALYNAKATLAEPDYRSALAYLAARWRKRSLMVCFTDLWDPDSSRQTITELAALQPRHLVAAVTLLDTKVLRAAGQGAETAQAVYEKAVAMQVLEDREKAAGALTQRGVLVVDSPADKLSAELVNRYLEVKERMLL